MSASPHASGRIQTPYGDFTTPEVVAARRSLSELIAGDDEAANGPIGELVVWSTIELAERLSAFVEHVDGRVFGAALEGLAIDLGIVRGPKPQSQPIPPLTPLPLPSVAKRAKPRLQALDLVNGRFVRR